MSSEFVVMASGRGSGFEAILTALKKRELNASLRGLICDRPDAPVIEKANRAGIPVIQSLDYSTIASELLKISPQIWVVLSGYMRILPLDFLKRFAMPETDCYRVVNIHPSLLPSFPGKNAYSQAFEHGVKITGVSVHLVDAGLDSGPICAQEAFSIEGCETVEEVEKKGLSVEHRLYPTTLEWLISGEFQIQSLLKGRKRVLPR